MGMLKILLGSFAEVSLVTYGGVAASNLNTLCYS